MTNVTSPDENVSPVTPIATPAVFPELAAPDNCKLDLAEMSRAQMLAYVNCQLKFLTDQYNSIKDQLTSVKSDVAANNVEIARRVERLTSLMTNHMACFKQLVGLLDTYGNKLTQKDKDDAKRDLAHAGLVDRQNRFSSSLAKLTKSGNDIVTEIETIKQRLDEQDKFHWKVICVFTFVATALCWLFAGDNFAKIIVAIKSLGN